MANESRSSDNDKQTSGVTIGDVEGGIHGSKIAGHDIIDVVIQIVQQTGGQIPKTRNLPAQLAALQQALPHLTDPAEKVATQATIDKLERAIADLPTHEQRYRERIKVRYAEEAEYYIPLAGETTETVPVQAEPKAPRSARRRRQRAVAEYCEWVPTEKEIKRFRLNTLREGVDKYPCIILLGDPGSGKTTALENLAYQFADEPGKLPVPLRLSEFGPGVSVEDFIIQGWAGSLDANHWGAPELASDLEGYLEAGKLFLLFDALNEMPREGYNERTLALRRFIDQWSAKGNRFLVTCRVLDYGEELSGLQRVEVQPLNDDQIQVFLQNELPEDWQALWQTLTESSDGQRRLLEMARNPYLLTIMIDVFDEDGQLGQNRAELMDRFTQILLAWAKAKCPLGKWLDADVQREALSVLASEIQSRSGFGTMIKTEHAKAVMPQQVQLDPDWPPILSPSDQVLTLAASANIIETPVDRSSVRFYHQLLQEYFAARQMLKQDPATLTGLWRWPWLEEEMPLWVRTEDNLDPLPPPPPTNWEETTILAAGLAMKNDDQLVRTLIPINPVLAGRCLYEGQAKVDKIVRQAVIDVLLSTLANPGVALRVRIAAGEILGYLGDPRLGEMVTIPVGGFLMGEGKEQHETFLSTYRFGKYPVTNAEYRRFIEAGGYQQKHWWTEAGWTEKESESLTEPHYWRDTRFNRPNWPVVGVSWYECDAYCHWLSAETGQQYRLPTEAEWEKAARGRDGRRYPWGNEFEASRLNSYEGEQTVRATTPVGIYPTGVSPFGAFDCAGNVWEWCATKIQNDHRILRGGSWVNYRNHTSCTSYFWHHPRYGEHDWGCRLVSHV